MSEDAPEPKPVPFYRRLSWIVAGIACLVALGCGWALWHERDDGSPRRWATLDWVYTDPEFTALLTPQRIMQPIPLASPNWGEPHVSVYTFAPVSRPPVTLRDLADNGQAHAIDFLAKNTTSEPHTWSQLQEALTNAQSSAAAAKDPFKFDRVLVSTVTKGVTWLPGDRMVWTRVFVQPINFEFGDYSIEATQNESDKIAQTEASHSSKLGLDLSVGVPGAEGSKIDVAPSSESDTKTTKDVDSQYEKLGVDILPGFLRIVRESSHDGDVAGNALISVSLITDPATIQKKYPSDEQEYATGGDFALLVTETHLTDSGGHDLGDGEATITALPQAVLPHCPLIARVWMLYEERQIQGRGEFYDEAHHEVKLLNMAEKPQDVVIVTADDVSPAVWRLKLVPPGGDKPVATTSGAAPAPDDTQNEPARPDEFLQGHADEQSPWRDIVFTDYGQASAMAHWVRYDYKDKLGALKLNYKGSDSLLPFKGTQLSTGCQTKQVGAATATQSSVGVYKATPIAQPITPTTQKSQ